MRSGRITALVAATALLAACSGGGDGEAAAAPDRSQTAEAGSWTVLAYSIADTDLEPFLLGDLDELGTVGGNEHLDVVALVDRAADYSADGVLGLGDWTGARVLEVGGTEATVVEELGDVNTGDPAVLADFIAAGVEAYPADNYALVISDHGASWPGVGGDESADHDVLTLDELDQALASGLDAAGLDRLDLLGFDACLMATYEVASALAPHADRLLASQELEPGHGWDYTSFGVAAAGPVTVDELGAALLEGFRSQAKDEGTSAEITLSLIDLTRMGAVDDAVTTFSAALAERGADVAPVVGRSLATGLGFGRSPDPYQDSQMTDLGALAGEIGVEALDLADAADALVRALGDAVIDQVRGELTGAATGLSIYFPPTGDLFDDAYREVGGPWVDFLDRYYAVGGELPEEEQARFVVGDAEIFFDEDGLNIAGTFDLAGADNLSEAFVRYGLVEDDGSVTFVGSEPAAIGDDGQALGIYDLTLLTMADGEDVAYAYLDLTYDEDANLVTIDVPLGYYAPGDVDGETYQDVLLTLLLDGDSGDVLNETYYVYDADLGTYGEATLDPAGLIVPEVPNILDDGTEEWLPTTDVGLYADLPSLQYDLESLESGTELYVELVVVDYGGNSDSVSAVVTVP